MAKTEKDIALVLNTLRNMSTREIVNTLYEVFDLRKKDGQKIGVSDKGKEIMVLGRVIPDDTFSIEDNLEIIAKPNKESGGSPPTLEQNGNCPRCNVGITGTQKEGICPICGKKVSLT